ncbi:GDSL esterase/lipase At4g10955-like [Silene latifolia]|uniref:GDSL esterase/lipase At4g10955-like n=1 Tax=Silene latifolia TaxID=37657 RepID=UPI003D76AB4F
MTKGKKEEEEEETKAPSEREIFGVCGPIHLNIVDWRVPDQRRSIAASLVQGVYVLERDRQNKRTNYEALAPIWWDFFHFQCIQILVDKVDSSTFGAIFQYKPYNPNQYYNIPPQCLPPKYVIAFRGTLIKPGSRKRDIMLDMQLALNGLTRNTRYQTSLQTVQDLIARVGPQNVWLAGHSLGAAIALQIGKTVARTGLYIESYLFNPPYSSAPIEKLTDPILKNGFRVAGSILTAGLSVALKGTSSQHNDPFTILRPWIPYLFVNENDPISCEYIGYFEHREKMEAWGVGGIERIAAKDTLVSLVSGVCGRDGEALHLIPSAFVVKNLHPLKDEVKLAHGIHQWWECHPYWQPKLFQFR